MQKTARFPLLVELNGMTDNQFSRLGLSMNPFPQIAKAELMPAMLQLNKLAATPIPHDSFEQFIRATLTGWSEEFVALCVRNFQPGRRVRFVVWLDGSWIS